ncbi:MAG: hypothetical protein EKK29_07050 [Hyphomicrobiales bacterium]|nr:MAG: hypothetical protein EKK29_07050 [Hyphomicrobiales bacterium]
MAAFLIAGVGRTPMLERALNRAFKSIFRLSESTWLVSTPGEAKVSEVVGAIGLKAGSDDAIIIQLEATTVHGVADTKVWRFIDHGLGERMVCAKQYKSSVYD